MANKQQPKSDKKHRKLTKSPQVSCDISMLSSSPTTPSGFIGSASGGKIATTCVVLSQTNPSVTYPLNPPPKHVAYPSSFPIHPNDECLLKNYEYSRADVLPTDNIQSFTISPMATKGNDDLHRYHHHQTIKTIDSSKNQQDIRSGRINEPGASYVSLVDQQIRQNVVYVENPITMPACCIKSSMNSGTPTVDKYHHTILAAASPPLPSTHTGQILTTPSPSSTSAATTFSEHLRNIKHMFQSASGITNSSTAATVSSAGYIPVNVISSITTTIPKNSTSFESTNPFALGNFFKSNDKTIAAAITTPTTVCGGSLGCGGSTSVNTTVSDNIKRDEVLKATMKICLVVSPPSNKLLQLKSKSLTHLDTLESHSINPESPPKPKADYLEVQNSSTNTICCLSTSQSSSNSSIKKKSPSLKSCKRPMLKRSEVSSSEYFRVCYDLDNGFCDREEELIPAVKGTTLAEALCGGLARRNLSFSQITISDNNFQHSMDLSTPPYSGGVNQNTDVSNLAGKCITVTEKETSGGVTGSSVGGGGAGSNAGVSNNTISTSTIKKSGLQKAASFGARQRPAKLFQSASTEETTEASDAKTSSSSSSSSKQPKQRWSVLFGLKNPQQNQLCEILNQYARNGVTQSELSYLFDHPDLQTALDYLQNIHSSWMEFVCHPDMTDNEIKIQTAIWELVTTEVDYIHVLKTVTDLFLACLEGIQSEHILNEVDQHKLFANIRDICEANVKFWTLYLYPMVRHSINTGHPMCVDYFQQGFVTFATTFAPYKKYCAEQSTCQFYCKELQRNNSLFQAYLAWCEAQKLCNRLRLADILVRPMQRLTKYNLLLSAIKKHITDENDSEIMDAMIHSVENFVCSVNSHLTTRQENERLKGIMARIESYDVVDSNNEHLDKIAKQYSTMFDLCGPMKGCATTQGRHLFMEGDLKFKDNINKVDVHCFLLTDVLLVCKSVAKKGLGTLKVIRQPFITDRLVIKVKENTLYAVYLNEYNVAVTAFTLQCPEAKSWHDAIAKAKHIYSRLKQGSSWDGYNIKQGNSSEMLGVRKSPLNSSIGSKVSSLNNSHSGSVELTESKTVSIDNEKTNSLSSDEGLTTGGGSGAVPKKVPQNSPTKFKAMSSNTLVVQPLLSLGQSLPNLNLNAGHATNNTLLVPGSVSTSGHSNLLSPSHRGISYPPPSPTRATLRRGFAFSSSIKNPPLVKSRNITSQNSFSVPVPPSSTSTQSSSSSSGQSTSNQQQQQQQMVQQQHTHQHQSPRDQNIHESDV